MTAARHIDARYLAELHPLGGFEIVAHGQGQDGGRLVLCSRAPHPALAEAMHATAHVLAASNDMLAALRLALPALEAVAVQDFDSTALPALQAVHAAIAKAEGRDA